MKNNSLAYVVTAFIILAGCIAVSFLYNKGEEEYNIIYTISGKRCEAIIYTNNTVKVGYKNCLGSNCYTENKEYKYSKEKMNDFRKMVSSIDYEDYDSSKDYTNIIYIVELEKAIYDSSIIKNQELNNITIKILTGEY